MEKGAQKRRTRTSAMARLTRRMLTIVLSSALVTTERQTRTLPNRPNTISPQLMRIKNFSNVETLRRTNYSDVS